MSMVNSGSSGKHSEKGHPLVIEDFIGICLRWGVLISAGVVILGVVLALIKGGTGYPPGSYPTGISTVLRGVHDLRPFAVIELGLLLLIATPVFRVASSLVAFALERDFPYVLITAYVLLMLLIGLFL